MLDEIIIILSTFQPLSIANFALCKKNRGLFMAKFSMYYSSAFETKPGWLAVTMARISKFCLNIIGISFALWSQDYLSFFRFSGTQSCTAQRCIASFLSGGFTATAVINPPDWELANCIFVHWCNGKFHLGRSEWAGWAYAHPDFGIIEGADAHHDSCIFYGAIQTFDDASSCEIML